MTDASSDASSMPNLADLITGRRTDRGWTYAQLQERSNDAITRQRWQQLGTGVRIKEFPEPTTLEAMAAALDVEVTRVVLAAARSIGLDVRPGTAGLAGLLPAGTENLTEDERDAILHVIRVMLRHGGGQPHVRVPATDPTADHPVVHEILTNERSKGVRAPKVSPRKAIRKSE